MPSASNSGQTIPSASTPIQTYTDTQPLCPRRHRHCHPHPQPHARRKYPFRRQSPLLRLSSLHPPDQRIRHLQATPTSRPTQLLSHHRQPRLVLRFQAIRKPCQRPRPPPHTDIMSHFYSPKSPDPVLFSLGNERSHVYAYLPTFSIYNPDFSQKLEIAEKGCLDRFSTPRIYARLSTTR